MLKLLLLTLLLIPKLTWAQEPTILLNELAWMGTEVSASDEWLELYNSTDAEIDLTGWRLEATDGSPKIDLTGTISAGGFFIAERTDDDTLPNITANQIYTGALSNTSEWLKLYDATGQIIDEINATDGWPGGDNTTKQTLERTAGLTWQTSAEPGGTPQQANSQTTPPPQDTNPQPEPTTENEPESPARETNYAAPGKGDVIFTEVLPNPADLNQEFIEIQNVGAGLVDLTDSQIITAAGQIFIIPSLVMTPQSIVVFYRSQTKLALNNLKEKIKLKSHNRIIDELSIAQTAAQEQSYARTEGDNWQWTDSPTPGEINNLANPKNLPVTVIYGPKTAAAGEIIDLDGSDSFSPIGEELTYFWDFGNGQTDQRIRPRAIYTQSGGYQITLTVSSPTASSTESLKIKISDNKIAAETTSTTATSSPETLLLTTPENIPFIFLSEFLPNPKGLDETGEFIELFSQENLPIDLTGWQLDDAEGGSRPYTIPAATIIKPGQYLVFNRAETKLALNNSDESIRLISPQGSVIDVGQYEDSQEGTSYVRDENFSWQESKTPTPGEINVLDQTDTTEEKKPTEEKNSSSTPMVLGASLVENPETKSSPKTKYLVATASAVLVIGLAAGLKIKNGTQH